jgi:L-aspartate oxidase
MNQFDTDFLVIGSGISGLSFALKAAELGRVTIITKKAKVDSATNLAQGGIAAVLSAEDSFDLHIQDTLRSGAGLCKEEIVRLVVENGPARVRELLELGVRFSAEAGNAKGLDLGKEGGHSARRIAHAHDLTGREIERALLGNIEAPGITVLKTTWPWTC